LISHALSPTIQMSLTVVHLAGPPLRSAPLLPCAPPPHRSSPPCPPYPPPPAYLPSPTPPKVRETAQSAFLAALSASAAPSAGPLAFAELMRRLAAAQPSAPADPLPASPYFLKRPSSAKAGGRTAALGASSLGASSLSRAPAPPAPAGGDTAGGDTGPGVDQGAGGDGADTGGGPALRPPPSPLKHAVTFPLSRGAVLFPPSPTSDTPSVFPPSLSSDTPSLDRIAKGANRGANGRANGEANGANGAADGVGSRGGGGDGAERPWVEETGEGGRCPPPPLAEVRSDSLLTLRHPEGGHSRRGSRDAVHASALWYDQAPLPVSAAQGAGGKGCSGVGGGSGAGRGGSGGCACSGVSVPSSARLLPAYEAEGLLGLAVAMLPDLPPLFLLRNWAEHWKILDLYLAHQVRVSICAHKRVRVWVQNRWYSVCRAQECLGL
jgi:hypothetical protein